MNVDYRLKLTQHFLKVSDRHISNVVYGDILIEKSNIGRPKKRWTNQHS